MTFLIIGLAAWRLASLLVNEDGPFYVFYKLRVYAGVGRIGETGPLALVLSCLWCASIWTGALAVGLWHLWPPIDYALAASALAILAGAVLERLERP